MAIRNLRSMSGLLQRASARPRHRRRARRGQPGVVPAIAAGRATRQAQPLERAVDRDRQLIRRPRSRSRRGTSAD
jgi:hypothetical protein